MNIMTKRNERTGQMVDARFFATLMEGENGVRY
jgi:hypothetical protein